MSQARGSAVSMTMLVLCTIMLVLSFEFADAAKYTVGDDKGWAFNTQNWPAGKKFVAGDVLVFKYALGAHNVVAVDENAYNSCIGTGQTYFSGNDEIVLKKGKNFFICTYLGHCLNGMKIAIDAA